VQDFVQNFNIQPRTLAGPICIQIAAFMHMLDVGRNAVDRARENHVEWKAFSRRTTSLIRFAFSPPFLWEKRLLAYFVRQG
jgi:hypothetical protein